MEDCQEAVQARVEATANEIRAFARGYASAVEAHCLSLLRHLEEIRVQRRYDRPTMTFRFWSEFLFLLSASFCQIFEKMLGLFYEAITVISGLLLHSNQSLMTQHLND